VRKKYSHLPVHCRVRPRGLSTTSAGTIRRSVEIVGQAFSLRGSSVPLARRRTAVRRTGIFSTRSQHWQWRADTGPGRQVCRAATVPKSGCPTALAPVRLERWRGDSPKPFQRSSRQGRLRGNIIQWELGDAGSVRGSCRPPATRSKCAVEYHGSGPPVAAKTKTPYRRNSRSAPITRNLAPAW